PEQLDRLVSGLSVDLTPPTDDRPFFFNQLPLARAWTEALDWQLYNRTGVKAGNLLASVTLLIILVLATLFVIIVILVPLRPAIRAASARLAIAGSAYFVCLGLGFMFVEIGLLQRLSLFLGHPVYSLSIVLFGLVLATGIGSFLSERLPLSS